MAPWRWPFSKPAKKHEKTYRVYSEVYIGEICDKLMADRNFVQDEGWVQLSRYLRVHDRINPTPSQSNRVNEMCYLTLSAFVSAFGRQAMIQHLREALVQMKRKYILDLLEEYAPECVLAFDGPRPLATGYPTILPSFPQKESVTPLATSHVSNTSHESNQPSVAWKAENPKDHSTFPTTFYPPAKALNAQHKIVATPYIKPNTVCNFSSTDGAGNYREPPSPCYPKNNGVVQSGSCVGHVLPAARIVAFSERMEQCSSSPTPKACNDMEMDTNDILEAHLEKLQLEQAPSTKTAEPLVTEIVGDNEIILTVPFTQNTFMPKTVALGVAKNLVTKYSRGRLAASETNMSRISRVMKTSSNMKIKLRIVDNNKKNPKQNKTHIVQEEKRKMAKEMVMCKIFNQDGFSVSLI